MHTYVTAHDAFVAWLDSLDAASRHADVFSQRAIG
jgi:hypothetical protein